MTYHEKLEQFVQNVGIDLTPRQRDVLYYMLMGYGNSGVAEILGVKPSTVQCMQEKIYIHFYIPEEPRTSKQSMLMGLMIKQMLEEGIA